MLALFWAEILYQARGLITDRLQSCFITINCIVFALQVKLFAIEFRSASIVLIMLNNITQTTLQIFLVFIWFHIILKLTEIAEFYSN
jgi:hypothetical protein